MGLCFSPPFPFLTLASGASGRWHGNLYNFTGLRGHSSSWHLSCEICSPKENHVAYCCTPLGGGWSNGELLMTGKARQDAVLMLRSFKYHRFCLLISKTLGTVVVVKERRSWVWRQVTNLPGLQNSTFFSSGRKPKAYCWFSTPRRVYPFPGCYLSETAAAGSSRRLSAIARDCPRHLIQACFKISDLGMMECWGITFLRCKDYRDRESFFAKAVRQGFM